MIHLFEGILSLSSFSWVLIALSRVPSFISWILYIMHHSIFETFYSALIINTFKIRYLQKIFIILHQTQRSCIN